MDYKELKNRAFSSRAKLVTPAFAHNLIYGALDYAAELGFEPHKDFAFAEHVLDDNLIDDGIDEITFGNNSKPFFMQGPYDNATKIITHLNKHIGKENYECILLADQDDEDSDISLESEIEAILLNVFFFDAPMSKDLYIAELEAFIDDKKEVLFEEKQDFTYVVTESFGSVAMALITKNDEVFINEDARQYLQNVWKDNYHTNIKHQLPGMINDLASGSFSITTVIITES